MNFKTLDLNLLRVLDALLATHSTKAAGEQIGLSQPAVSAALSRLRDSLHDPLFVRQGRKLHPTPFARELRGPLHQILEDTERLLRGADAFDPATSHQNFRISGSDFFADMLMPELAENIRRTAPNIRVQLVDLTPDNYIGKLERDDVDLALLPNMPFPKWIDHENLFLSEFVVIARRGHSRLARAGIQPGSVIPVDLFCDVGQVLFSPEGRLSAMGDAALARLGRKRSVVMTLPVFSGVYNTVAQSEYIALLPRQLAERVADRVGLDIYQAPMTVDPARISMAWHKRITASRPHVWLRGEITRVLRPLDATVAPGGASV